MQSHRKLLRKCSRIVADNIRRRTFQLDLRREQRSQLVEYNRSEYRMNCLVQGDKITGLGSPSRIAASPGTWCIKLTYERVLYVSHHIR